MGGKEGEAGGAVDKELSRGLAFILRTTGSWKPERGPSDPSGCRRDGPRGRRALCQEGLAGVRAG